MSLKLVHVTCVAASFVLFVIRGFWMMRGSAQLQRFWVRVVPHVVDSVLLASAVALALASHQYPLANDWLSAKLAGLLIYIGLGSVALKRGKTPGIRVAALIAALAVFFYIVAVALTHRPLPWQG